MSRITSNRFPVKYEGSVEALYEFLVDMDLDEMCDELGITKEEVLDRFKDKVYNYHLHVDGSIDDAYIEMFEEEDVDHHLHQPSLDEFLEDLEKDE